MKSRELLKPQFLDSSQSAFTCSKLTIDTLEQGIKYAKS